MTDFLILENDRLAAHSYALALNDHGSISIVASMREAREMLESERPMRGLILELELPDGCGLDLLEHVRVRDGEIDALVVTGSLDREIVNRAAALGALVALKPFGNSIFVNFLARLSRRDRTPVPAFETAPTSVTRIVSKEASRCCLTPRETQILKMCVEGNTRERIVASLNISTKTYANHATSILMKTDCDSMQALAIRLLLEAL